MSRRLWPRALEPSFTRSDRTNGGLVNGFQPRCFSHGELLAPAAHDVSHQKDGDDKERRRCDRRLDAGAGDTAAVTPVDQRVIIGSAVKKKNLQANAPA